MAESFDPYHIWLGIPPSEQPADHYRLLGISRFESNLDVIANAADQRVRHIRSMQTGKRQAESQRLLNEIAAASGVLLDSDAKRRYDDYLRLGAAQIAPAVAPAAPAAAPAPAGTSLKWVIVAGGAAVSLAAILLIGLVLLAGSMFPNRPRPVVQPPFAAPPFAQAPLSQPLAPPPRLQPTTSSVPTALPVKPAPTEPGSRSIPKWVAEYGTYDNQRYSPIAEGRLLSVLKNTDSLKNRITFNDFDVGYALCGAGGPDFAFPDWYLFEARLTRLEGEGPLSIGFPMGPPMTLALDDHRDLGFLSGLTDVRSTRLPNRDDETRWAGRLIELNAPVKLKLYVGNGCACGLLERGSEVVPVFNWVDPGLVRRVGESHGSAHSSPFHIRNQFSRWLLEDCFVTPLYLKSSPALAYNDTRTPGAPTWLFELKHSPRLFGQLLTSFPIKSLAGEKIPITSREFQTSPDGLQSCEFQAQPPANYTLLVEIQRVRGTGPLAVDFPVAGKECRIVLEHLAQQSYWSGIERIAGLPLESRQDPSVAQGKKIEGGKNLLRIHVSGSRVCAKLSSSNHVDYFCWSGDPKQLGRSESFPQVTEGLVGVSTRDAAFTLALTLTPLEEGGQLRAVTDSGTGTKVAISATPTSSTPPATTPPATGGTTSTRLPIPAADDLAKAREKLKEAFGDLDQKKKPEEKRFLAREFITGSQEEKDAAVCYAMLDAARILAVEAQDLQLAMEVDQRICGTFAVDTMQQYLGTLKLASGKAMPANKWEEFGRKAFMLAKAALTQRESGMADEGSKIAIEFSAKGKDADLKKEARQLRDQVVAYRQNEESFQQAFQKLATDPQDPEANLMVGRWYCLFLGDFPKGLPHLFRGAESPLAAAAQAEQQSEAKPLAVADAWFEAAGKLAGPEKVAAWKHAREFYTKAKENSSGLEQLRAGKRETEVRQAIEAAEKGKPVRPATKVGK